MNLIDLLLLNSATKPYVLHCASFFAQTIEASNSFHLTIDPFVELVRITLQITIEMSVNG